MEEYKKRADHADELISLLTSKIESLEKKVGSGSGVGVGSGARTNLKFKDEESAKNYVSRNDKFWFFNETWQGVIKGNSISVRGYPALSDEEFKTFTSSSKTVPDKICRFDQYFSKQLKTKENKFEPESFTFEQEVATHHEATKTEQPKKKKDKNLIS